jgi:hypothetical protein
MGDHNLGRNRSYFHRDPIPRYRKHCKKAGIQPMKLLEKDKKYLNKKESSICPKMLNNNMINESF